MSPLPEKRLTVYQLFLHRSSNWPIEECLWHVSQWQTVLCMQMWCCAFYFLIVVVQVWISSTTNWGLAADQHVLCNEQTLAIQWRSRPVYHSSDVTPTYVLFIYQIYWLSISKKQNNVWWKRKSGIMGDVILNAVSSSWLGSLHMFILSKGFISRGLSPLVKNKQTRG